MISSTLLSLFSPLLPIGGFTWSQGLEKAVEDGLVVCEESLTAWVRDTVSRGLVFCELPLLMRLYQASLAPKDSDFRYWNEVSMAVRPTSELRAEEYERGRALLSILPALGISLPSSLPSSVPLASGKDSSRTKYQGTYGYLALLAYAAVKVGISQDDLLQAFIFSYTEGAVMAGAKSIPLGQNAAWRIITDITGQNLDSLLCEAGEVVDEEIGSGLTVAAIESAMHETMYSRIYRN